MKIGDKVYLKDGTKCILREVLNDSYRVNILQLYFYDEDCTAEEESKYDTFVQEVFKLPPTKSISEKVQKLLDEEKRIQSNIDALKIEVVNLNREIINLRRTIINNEKFIINKTELINAKSIALFPKDRIIPLLLNSNDKSFRSLKVSLEIEIGNNNERSWGYKISNSDNTFGYFLDPEDGILINPTQEQIDEVIKAKVLRKKWQPYYLSVVEDKYLTEDHIKIKQEYLKKQYLDTKARLLEQKEEISKQLKELENEQ